MYGLIREPVPYSVVDLFSRDVRKTEIRFGSVAVFEKPNRPKILTSVQTVFRY